VRSLADRRLPIRESVQVRVCPTQGQRGLTDSIDCRDHHGSRASMSYSRSHSLIAAIWTTAS
jgi:hypothetical protein